MDFDDLIKYVIAIAFLIYKVREVFKKNTTSEKPTVFEQIEEEIETRAPPPRPVAPAGPSFDPRSEYLDTIDRLATRGKALAEEAIQSPQSRAIGEVIQSWWLVEIQRFRQAISDSTIGHLEMQSEARKHTELLRHLHQMVMQRKQQTAESLSEADAIVNACYAPVRDFANAHNVELSTHHPFAMYSPDALSILFFRDTPIASLNVPTSLNSSVWYWPAIAHEVAHDTFRSVNGLESWLRGRLQAPERMALPIFYREQEQWSAFGSWLEEIFCDLFGVLMMGPAYVHSMSVVFANPREPARTRIASAYGQQLGEHPPGDLRIRLAVRVLTYLGFHEEASMILDRWNETHADVPDAYFMRTNYGQLIPVPEEQMLMMGEEIISFMLKEQWPVFAEYPLISIPELVYTHHDDSHVKTLKKVLSGGQSRHAEARHLIAAAVLAVVDDPSVEPNVITAMHQSIIGVGEKKTHKPTDVTHGPAPSLAIDKNTLIDAVLMDVMLSRR